MLLQELFTRKGRLTDLKGRKFGMLLVLSKVRTAKGKKQNWRCKCDCGNHINVRHDYLLHTNSPKTHCGCKNKGLSITHKEEYHIHNSMLQRCFSPTHVAYKEYGGRGITVCDRWRDPTEGLKNFLADLGRRPSKGHSIDRIDPNGNYEPGNVRWATTKHQARNKRKSLYLPHPKDPTKLIPAAEVAELLEMTYHQLRYKYIKEGKWPSIQKIVNNACGHIEDPACPDVN